MTNLEKFITEMASKIKQSGGADNHYHWSELVMVLEETLKYIPSDKPISRGHQELVFVGYTNPYQLVHSCANDDEASGSFYPNTKEDTTIPLYMLKCHERRLINLTDGDLTVSKLIDLQNGGEL